MIYQSIRADEPLSQGDIIDGCPIFGAEEVAAALAPQASDNPVVRPCYRPHASL